MERRIIGALIIMALFAIGAKLVALFLHRILKYIGTRSNSSISQDPAPRARFRVFGDSALQFELLCWAKKPADRGRVIHELNSAVYRKFQQKNITIPFPQQDIYLHSLSSNASGLSDDKEESKK